VEAKLEEKVPIGHKVHTEAPGREKNPSLHNMQAAELSAPSIFEKYPAGHLIHVTEPDTPA
jgi:hypothetical protein